MSRDVTPIHALEGEGDPERDPDPEKNKQITLAAEYTKASDQPTHATPPPDESLAFRVQQAANLYSPAVISLVERYAAALTALGKDIVLEAQCWREKYPTATSSSLKAWLENEANPDRPRKPPTPPRKFNRLTDASGNGHKPPSRDGPISTPSKTMTRIRNIA